MKTVATNQMLFLWAIALTLIFEVITCVMRFGLKLESTRDTASTIGRMTCGLRSHHVAGVLAVGPISEGQLVDAGLMPYE